MFNVGGGEIVVIALVALIVLGPDKLPGAMRKLGQFVNEIKSVSDGFGAQMRTAMLEDDTKPPVASTSPATEAATQAPLNGTSPDDDAEPADITNQRDESSVTDSTSEATAHAVDEEPTPTAEETPLGTDPDDDPAA